MSEASSHHHKKVFDVVFIGNFVQDTVVTPDGLVSHAMGGSVTYGPLAASSFVKNSATKKEIEANITIITSQFGDDLTEENKQFIAKRFKEDEHIKILTCENQGSKSTEKHTTTAYKLVYDKEGCRTLTLANKGGSISTEGVLKHIFNDNKHEGKEEGSASGIPDAILFVPVAGEFDEQLVIEVVEKIKEKKKALAQTGKKYKIERPIVVTDIQGFIRTFKGTAVMARDAETLRHKMQRVAPYITLLKAEYSEALAVVGSTTKRPSPKKCAILLKQMYKIPIVSVTLGPAGSFVAYDSELDVTAHTVTPCPNVNIEDQHSEEDGIVCTYVPTFIPNQVVDETGSGDCFLACTVIEMLIQKSKNTIISAVETGSAATSFRVEKRGPTGFTSREEILERMKTGKRMEFSNAQNAIFTKYEEQ